MMKSFILAATSIVCISSIPNIVAANDIKNNINYTVQKRSNSIAKKTTVSASKSIPQSELNSIRKEIIDYYTRHNRKEEKEGGIGVFYEVTKINVLEFSMSPSTAGGFEKSAIVESFQTNRAYNKYLVNERTVFTENNRPDPNQRMIIHMKFDREINKWQIGNRYFNQIWKPE
jgi:hypothetical protein